MSVVRLCLNVMPVPSARIVQTRSSSCQVPSWQYSSRFGSTGLNCMWFRSPYWWPTSRAWPVFRSVKTNACSDGFSARGASPSSLVTEYC